MVRITNAQIAYYKTLKKVVVNANRKKWKTALKNKSIDFELRGESVELTFKLYARQNCLNEDNFSCGISLCRDGDGDITLARYNGSNHTHTNKYDGQKFVYVCHIHQAKEECLSLGCKIEDYAEATDRYTTLQGAVICLLRDFNIFGLTLDNFSEIGGLFDELQ